MLLKKKKLKVEEKEDEEYEVGRSIRIGRGRWENGRKRRSKKEEGRRKMRRRGEVGGKSGGGGRGVKSGDAGAPAFNHGSSNCFCF